MAYHPHAGTLGASTASVRPLALRVPTEDKLGEFGPSLKVFCSLACTLLDSPDKDHVSST